MISVSLYGRLGNHLFQYAVCRTIAEMNSYEYHIPRNFLGTFFGCSLGVGHDNTDKVYPKSPNHDAIQRYDEKMMSIADGTKLEGYFQTEKYFLHNRENILKWFYVPDNPSLMQELEIDDNTCILNIRGNEYKNIKDVFLHIDFWKDSMNHMKKINPDVNFLIVTDDVQLSKTWFPNIKVYHGGIMDDFTLINKAKYLIIANSTFSWWAAWLNENANLIIAPKYWFRYNVSESFWSPGDGITKKFSYMDRNGNFQTSEECENEITEKNYEDLKEYLISIGCEVA